MEEALRTEETPGGKDRDRHPDQPDREEERDDDVPETPPTEPPPVPVKEPPGAPDERGPFVVRTTSKAMRSATRCYG